MAHGGKRPNAGRKPSALTVKTREEAEAIIESGITPLSYFRAIYEGRERLDPDKFEAAKAAAPYIHPRLAAIEHSGEMDHNVTHATKEQRDAAVAAASRANA